MSVSPTSALAVVGCAVAAALYSCAGGEDPPTDAADPKRVGGVHGAQLQASAVLPESWHRVRRALTNLYNPEEILNATSYDPRDTRGHDGCRPTAAINGMPAGGTLVQVLHRRGGSGTVDGFDERAPTRAHLDHSSFVKGGCVDGFSTFFRRGDYVLQAWVRFRSSEGNTGLSRGSPDQRRAAEEILKSVRVRRGSR